MQIAFEADAPLRPQTNFVLLACMYVFKCRVYVLTDPTKYITSEEQIDLETDEPLSSETNKQTN